MEIQVFFARLRGRREASLNCITLVVLFSFSFLDLLKLSQMSALLLTHKYQICGLLSVIHKHALLAIPTSSSSFAFLSAIASDVFGLQRV